MKLSPKITVLALGAILTAGLVAPATADAAPVARKAAFKVTLKASSTKAIAGKPLIIAGKVRPAVKGTPVVLQKKLAGRKWVVEARLKTSKKGVFRYTDKPNQLGVRQYRAVVPKAGKVKPGMSKAVKVTVYHWMDLTDIAFRQHTATSAVFGASIAGKTLGPSIGGAQDVAQGSADWNIPAGCTTLRVRIGNGDQTDLDARANIHLDGGPGQFVHTGSYGLGESQLKSFNVSKVLRLTFSWTSTVTGSEEPTSGAQALLGEPQLLCAS